jgi:hypothetical protein
LAWVFGIDKAWEEMHKGSQMRVPRIFRFIIKYITPACLLTLLGWWLVTEWWDVITMVNVPAENIPYVLGTRLLLLAILIGLAIMVFVAWRKRDPEKYY